MAKLRVVPLALSLGITWGLCAMLLGWVAGAGWGARIVDVLASFYRGYAPTFWGGVIGGIWGFGDGFIGGLVLGGFYNLFTASGGETVDHVVPQPETHAHAAAR